MGFDSLSSHLRRIVMAWGVANLLILLFELSLQTGTPTHVATIDHSAHIFKIWLAENGSVFYTNLWFGEQGYNAFAVSPFFVLLGIVLTNVFDYFLAYKIILTILTAGEVFLISINPWLSITFSGIFGIRSMVLGRVPSLFAHLLSIYGFLGLINGRRKTFSIALFFADFFQPTVAMLYVYLAFWYLLGKNVRDLKYLVLPVCGLVVMALVFLSVYPYAFAVNRAGNCLKAESTTDLLRKIAQIVVFVIMPTYLLATRTNESFAFKVGVVSVPCLFFLSIFFPFLPFSKVFLISLEIFILAIFGVFWERIESPIKYSLLLALPLGTLLLFPVYPLSTYAMPSNWHSSVEVDLQRCKEYLIGETVVVLGMRRGLCSLWDPITPYLNIELNARTPQGWTSELIPPDVREWLNTVTTGCCSGRCPSGKYVAIVPVQLCKDRDDIVLCVGEQICVVRPKS